MVLNIDNMALKSLAKSDRIPSLRVMLLVSCFMVAGSIVQADSLSGINMEEFQKKSAQQIRKTKNPFAKTREKAPSRNLQVSGIIHGDYRKAALISGKIVSVGDRIGGSEVVEIRPKSVSLRNENGIYQLSIEHESEKKSQSSEVKASSEIPAAPVEDKTLKEMSSDKEKN